MKKTLVGVLVGVLAAVVLAGAYLLLNTSTMSTVPSSPTKGELFISNPPALGQTATITYRMTQIARTDGVENHSARIVLDEGLVWMSENYTGTGIIFENRYLIENIQLAENDVVEIVGVIKSVGTGEQTIEAFVTGRGMPENATFRSHGGAGRVLMGVLVTEDAAYVGDEYIDWNFGSVHEGENDSDNMEELPVQSSSIFSASLPNSPVLGQVVDLKYTVELASDLSYTHENENTGDSNSPLSVSVSFSDPPVLGQGNARDKNK